MDTVLRAVYRVSVVAIFAFMLLPIIIVLIASVSPTNVIDIFPSRISFRWFAEVLEPRWMVPLRFSLVLAAVVSVAATVLGLMGAFAVAYFRCPGNTVVMSFLLSPLSAPQIVTGIALLQFFAMFALHTRMGMLALFLGHVVVMLPFTTRMIVNAIHGFDRNMERAGLILGASPGQVLWYVILPLLKSGVFAALTFAFILSFNNIPISLFLAQPGTRTIAIAVINYLEYRIDPALAAVNVVCLLIILIIVGVVERFGRFTRALYGRD